MKKPRRADQPRVKAAAPEVVLWRPSIVLASRIEVPARRKPVTLAAPTAQPEAGEERIVGSILSLADTGAMLAARATETRARAVLAPSTLFMLWTARTMEPGTVKVECHPVDSSVQDRARVILNDLDRKFGPSLPSPQP